MTLKILKLPSHMPSLDELIGASYDFILEDLSGHFDGTPTVYTEGKDVPKHITLPRSFQEDTSSTSRFIVAMDGKMQGQDAYVVTFGVSTSTSRYITAQIVSGSKALSISYTGWTQHGDEIVVNPGQSSLINRIHFSSGGDILTCRFRDVHNNIDPTWVLTEAGFPSWYVMDPAGKTSIRVHGVGSYCVPMISPKEKCEVSEASYLDAMIREGFTPLNIGAGKYTIP